MSTPAHLDGTPVIDRGGIVDHRGDYPGRHRHRRPHPNDFHEGLVYWSDPAEAWMRTGDRPCSDEVIHRPDPDD